MTEKIAFKKLVQNAVLPSRGSSNAAGLDLYAAEDAVLKSKEYAPVKTGVAVAIPHGFYGRIAPRSGLAAKFGIGVLAGVIDSDYRGELVVLLSNHGQGDYEIKAGDRIAQLVLESIILPEPFWSEELSETTRGDNAFGSTGK